MRHSSTHSLPRILALLSAFALGITPAALAKTGILNTKHNLSVSGPGQIRALTETRVCVFCHTPHNATPSTPLWNRNLDPVSYILYSSSTSKATIQQPYGPTRLCLSCHDGTVALGAVKSVPGGIATTMEITPDRRSYLGTDISDDHPVAFDYHSALPNPELAASLPAGLIPYGPTGDQIHCSTCHDAHDDTYGKFLVMDNTYSALCVKCHLKAGWTTASHATSTAIWNGIGTNPWPHTSWATVAENGCENCHTPHKAGGPKRLLNYQQEEVNCYPCHNGNVAAKNVQAEFSKISAHPVDATTIGVTANAHNPAETLPVLARHVECVDCHNPHAANSTTANAPNVSGREARVKGISSAGAPVDPAAYEYEICFKCHADSETALPYINRVINETNKRVEFDPVNPSYHPVAAIGKNTDVPSLPSAFEPTLSETSMIYCTDCHDSDASPKVGGAGPRGPHGSTFSPILRQRYETADFTTESADAYALCYRCHDRANLLNPMVSGFRRHKKHIVGEQAPCAVCHDPHGVKDDGVSGSHTHLINFNTAVVSPASGQSVPFYVDTGSHTGYCVLVCHGKQHGSKMNYP